MLEVVTVPEGESGACGIGGYRHRSVRQYLLIAGVIHIRCENGVGAGVMVGGHHVPVAKCWPRHTGGNGRGELGEDDVTGLKPFPDSMHNGRGLGSLGSLRT